MLTREQILGTNDKSKSVTSVDVPEWVGTVSLRVLSGRQRERFETAVAKATDGNLRGLFASLCLCDEQGNAIFSEADVAALGEKSSKALDRIYQAGIKLNGIGKDGVDELEKNSEAAISEGTPSASLPGTESPTSIG